MAQLVTINGEQRLELLDEEIGRRISIGSNWNHLKIGARICVSNDFTDYYQAPSFVFGICNGTNNMFHSTNTTHFLGLRTIIIDWVNYSTYGMLFSNGWRSNDGALTIAKKIGNTITTLATPIGYTFNGIRSHAPAPTSTAFILEIIKGNPDWTFKIYTNEPHTQTTQDTFIKALHNPVVPSQYFQYVRTQTIAATNIDEATNGFFDTINTGWYSPLYKIYMNDIAYSVLA